MSAMVEKGISNAFELIKMATDEAMSNEDSRGDAVVLIEGQIRIIKQLNTIKDDQPE